MKKFVHIYYVQLLPADQAAIMTQARRENNHAEIKAKTERGA